MSDKTPTGWPPGMLQDDSRALSRALAGKPDAMRHAREAAAAAGAPMPTPTDAGRYGIDSTLSSTTQPRITPHHPPAP